MIGVTEEKTKSLMDAGSKFMGGTSQKNLLANKKVITFWGYPLLPRKGVAPLPTSPCLDLLITDKLLMCLFFIYSYKG